MNSADHEPRIVAAVGEAKTSLADVFKNVFTAPDSADVVAKAEKLLAELPEHGITGGAMVVMIRELLEEVKSLRA